MAGKRKAYTPFSTSSEAGVSAAPVEGFIEVDQSVRPTISTGFVDEKGIWQGNVTSDIEFFAFETHAEIANGATFNAPSANADGSWPLDMTGYCDIQLAVKPTNGGNYAIEAVMGSTGAPSELYANIQPLNAEAGLRGNTSNNESESGLYTLFSDTSEACTADVWNIFMIRRRLAKQKRLMFKFTNNSGDISTIETAFMRLV